MSGECSPPAQRELARVLITGIGLIGPGGSDRESCWQSLIRGDRCVRWLENGLPGRWAGAPLPQLAVAAAGDNRMQTLALQLVREALEDAELSPIAPRPSDRARWGVVIGTSKGVMPSAREDGSLPWPHLAAQSVAQTWDLQGPVLCPVAACATGLVCLWRGAELIRRGECDVVIAGSVDASLQPILQAAYRQMGVLAKIEDDPGFACRPFDRRRSGFLVGEGGAVMILESAASAVARGVTAYAEWLGGGILSDPTGMTALDDDAVALQVLIQRVLQAAQLEYTAIDVAALHGTATIPNDQYETRALRQVFGTHASRISCFGLKGGIGHLMGAAGSVETAAGLLAMRDRIVPPTVNLTDFDPVCDLDYTPHTARQRPLDYLLKISLGFGGHLAAAVFRRGDRLANKDRH